MKLASACALSRLFCVGLIGLASLGCGPGNLEDRPKGDVSGSVTLDEKPMPEGEISFSLPKEGPNVMEIKAGAFSGTALVGKNKVEIRAFKPGPALSTDPGGAPTKVNYIPAKYNHKSTLEADVPATGASDLKFAVTSK
jgi:hypothetical protein